MREYITEFVYVLEGKVDMAEAKVFLSGEKETMLAKVYDLHQFYTDLEIVVNSYMCSDIETEVGLMVIGTVKEERDFCGAW